MSKPLERVYFDFAGLMQNKTVKYEDTLYVGKDKIPLYTINEIMAYNPSAAYGVFIISDNDGIEVTMTLSACHVDIETKKTYIYSKDLHRVFKFDLVDTLFIFDDFVFFGDVTRQMCFAIPDSVGQLESIKLW